MQPVTLRVNGNFWDSQIYSAELILFDDEGGAMRVDWAREIDGFASKHLDVQTAIRVAFADSDLFYNNKVRKILLDPNIKAPIVNQLTSLASQVYDFSFESVKKQNSPFDFLPVDTEIYYNQIFAGDESGLYSAPRTDFNSLSRARVKKHHDARVFQIKASEQYTAVATAMGDDGLFEFEYDRERQSVLSDGNRIARRPCSACDWAFQSVVGWTTESSFFVNYIEQEIAGAGDRPKPMRMLDRIYDVDTMFSSREPESVVWGAREKMYQMNENGIYVSTYSPGKRKRGKKEDQLTVEEVRDQIPSFGDAGFIEGSFSKDRFVSAGTAPFGSVIELDDEIVVIRSDNEINRFPGEPVHWRIFPRSAHYSNQLHIIYEDYMLIVSFVHDYFVDQKSKLAGFAKNFNSPKEDLAMV